MKWDLVGRSRYLPLVSFILIYDVLRFHVKIEVKTEVKEERWRELPFE